LCLGSGGWPRLQGSEESIRNIQSIYERKELMRCVFGDDEVLLDVQSDLSELAPKVTPPRPPLS